MDRKEYILKKIEELEKERREVKKIEETPYKSSNMNCEKMPFGCWIWTALAVVIVIFIVRKIAS